jgi:uncharacterized protein (TIGR00369 family)
MNAFTLPPYADALGIELNRDDHGGPLLSVDFSTRVQGRPGFVHGGALSGLMEMAAIAALRTELARRGEAMKLKPVNIQVEFMRGGRQKRTFAKGEVTRAGRRVALINASAWQDEPDRPIALAQMKVLLSPDE